MFSLACSRRVFAVLVVGCVLGCEAPVAPEFEEPRAPVMMAAEVGEQATPPGAVAEDAPPARPGFCARPGNDIVRDVFCGPSAPAIDSLIALQRALKFDPMQQRSGGLYPGMNSKDGISETENIVLSLGAAMLGHSTALSGRLVSQLNPRAIIINDDSFMTFQRGVQRAEVATPDRDRRTLTFYLFSFTQPCNQRAQGCGNADLYTPRIEAGWSALDVRDDEQLKNTPSDCRQCHQRGRDKPMLLMRELSGPWVHFFAHDRDFGFDSPATPEPTGRDLVRDYLAAKGDETYAGLPVAMVRGTLGLSLEGRVDAAQPLIFESNNILLERWIGPEGQRAEPIRSAIWDETFEAFKRGEQLALPFYATRVTDPAKLAARTDAYARYRAGTLPAEELPDLSDVFPDDPLTRAEIGLQTTPGATPAQALVQACGGCHNDMLDQTISRAHFNVAVSRLSQAERELAVARLMLPGDHPQAMPPHEARALPADAREALIAYLRRPTPEEDVELLEHAAREGMAREMPRKPASVMTMPGNYPP